MADQDLRIKVSAETGAAQDALGKLSEEMGGLARASDKAGTEQQKLAKQTAETAQKVEAARQAVERAKRAQQEAAAVAQAFGKDSREAAEAMARLKVAEEAAAKAARESERALKGTAEAISEAGKGADQKAAAGLKRMNEQLQRAGKDADRTAGELRTLEARVVAMGAEAQKTGRAWDMFKKGLAFGAGAMGVPAGFEAIKATLGGAYAAARDFESGMADVRKVMPDGTTTAQMAALSEEMKRIASTVGVMPQDVAALTAELAQAGIAGQDLTATAEDAAKLKTAFDMSADAAGQALAKLRTSLGLSREGVNSLTGSINELSNKFAATAPEIIDAELRVAALTKAAGVSAESAAALATAMISSGASSEQAATGVKNFVSALASGQAATDRQKEAFAALGLDAVELSKRMAKGGKDADAVFVDVVKRLETLGKTSKEQVLPVMIELFGRETLGTIGPLASNVTLLGDTLAVAGDKAKALNSVQAEYEARSKTTASAVDTLKAQIAVLAVQFGDALLPHINKVVAFLTSKEGQDWGKRAVEQAVVVVTGLAEAVKMVGGAFGTLIDTVGGAGVAIGALGLAVGKLSGPFGIALSAGAAMGYGIASAVDSVVGAIDRTEEGLARLQRHADQIRRAERDAAADVALAQVDENAAANARERHVQALTDKWEELERTKRKVRKGSEEDLEITRKAARMRGSLLTGEGMGRAGSYEERTASFERSLAPEVAVPGLKSDAEKAAGKKAAADREGASRFENAMYAAKAYAERERRINEERFAFNQMVAEAEAKQSKIARDERLKREIEAFEIERNTRAKRIEQMSTEIDVLGKKAERERESIDLVFFTVEAESEARQQRDALIDQQIQKEAELARWEIKNAKTKEQRERAQTRLVEVEGKKRAMALQREALAEERAHHRRQEVIERVSGAVMTLGEGMVDAFERMAQGERGAIASMLAELLKGVAKKHAILALGEAALAVGAAASYRYAAAAQHGTAAALHTGVAVAAGVGAVAAGAIASARGAGQEDKATGADKGGGSSTSPGAGGRGATEERDGLEQQEVPLSHEQLRRADPSMRRGAEGGGVTINLQVGSIVGAGGVREVADMIRKELDRQDRGGRKARL